MSTGIIIALVVAAVAVGLVVWILSVFNAQVALRNRFRNAFAQIDVQLRRRYDLIPSLVETAKGYLAHERETLTAVIEARNVAAGAAKALAEAPGDSTAMKAFASAESGLAGVLSRLMMVVERYPELKADRQMARVSEELTSTENRIAFARQAYNDAVTEYNTKREQFPLALFSAILGSRLGVVDFSFPAAALLEATSAETQREAPQVRF